MKNSLPASEFRTPWSHYLIFMLIGVTFIAGIIWRVSPLHERYTLQTLIDWGRAARNQPWMPLAVIGTYVFAGLVLFVHAVVLWATVFIFDIPHAILYCELGSMASALAVYGLGRVVRPDVARKIAGSYLEKVSKALARKGVLTLVILHWFPICPFSMLNFISGATHISFEDFVIGTLTGITPGILFLCFFGKAVIRAAHHPHWINFAGLAVFVMVGWFSIRFLRRYVEKSEREGLI